MCHAIEHRGPDYEGVRVEGGCAIGMRRLSIIDLNTGHQPISNEDGTIWNVFNGEVDNYQKLRRNLIAKGHVFKADTETIIHLYDKRKARLASPSFAVCSVSRFGIPAAAPSSSLVTASAKPATTTLAPKAASTSPAS